MFRDWLQAHAPCCCRPLFGLGWVCSPIWNLIFFNPVSCWRRVTDQCLKHFSAKTMTVNKGSPAENGNGPKQGTGHSKAPMESFQGSVLNKALGTDSNQGIWLPKWRLCSGNCQTPCFGRFWSRYWSRWFLLGTVGAFSTFQELFS